MPAAASLYARVSKRESAGRWIVQEMHENAPIYAMIGLFFIATGALSFVLGEPLLSFLGVYSVRALKAVVLLCCAAVVIAAARSLIQKEHDSPLRYVRVTLLAAPSLQFAARYTFGCLVLTLFMGAFLYDKTAIPLVEPFSWDPVLSRWDAALFGGRHPWQVLMPFFGSPTAVYILDFLYGLWVPLVFVAWGGLLASAKVPSSLRRQFWLATIICWVVVGLVLASIFSSAGPCFAPLLFPQMSQAYAPLNAYLSDLHAHLPLASSLGKDYLWAIYSGLLDEPGGISAMPSMHNAQATLLALAGFRLNRMLGFVMLLFAAAIYVGSIVLAWHYAVDGIAGAALAFVIWHGCGLVAQRRESPQ